MSEQPALFQLPESAKELIRGTLRVVWTDDGRTLINVDGPRGGAWIELTPADQAWMVEHVVNPANAQPALFGA